MSIIEKALKAAGKSSSADTSAKAKTNAEVQENRTIPEEALRRGEDFLDQGTTESTSEYSGTADAGEANPAVTPLDRGVRDRSSVSGSNISTTGSKPKLILPFDELQARGFLTPNAPRSRIAEEYRGVKRPILRNIAGKDVKPMPYSNLVMVTSALQGDGKTFSSINLALSIAMEQDKTALFVDADVVRATAGKTLGVPRGTPGLIDLLDEQSDIDPADVIMHTNVDTLRVLPAGNISDKSTELLASDTMHHFMMELSNRYPDRVIVFDSPPLLLTTESSVLASFMGQIVFVASADVTPQHAVQEALEQIGEDKTVGVVLNRASRRRSMLLGIGSYGYGYGYGYAYGYGDRREDESKGVGAKT